MPLKEGHSKATIEANIKELIAASHPPDQAAAIAYKTAGISKDEYAVMDDATVSNALIGARAAGIMFRSGDSILLLKRTDKAHDYPGHWALPGGSIEGGETPEQAARREVQEETGYVTDGVMRKVAQSDGFVTFEHTCEQFIPRLDSEHSAFAWSSVDSLPSPLHPGIKEALTMSAAMDDTGRQFNEFGWMTIEGNPITKVGVFPYLGKQIGAPEPDRIYMVHRPEAELNNPETIESFKLTPFINEHPATLLGNVAGLVATDKKRVEGVFGEKVYFEYPYLKANLRVYSAQTLDSIEMGKEELSAGYNCQWVREDGVFEGMPYQYVQRRIRGNHGALVEEGRSGPDVSVMDSMTFNIENKELNMSMDELVASVKALTTQVAGFKSAMDSMEEKVEKMEAKDNEDEEAKKKAMDEEAEAKKKADEESKSKGEGMDAALAEIAALKAEVATLKAQPAALDSGALMAEMAKKTDLVNRVSVHIGTFACDSMSYDQVAEYAAEKLGLDKTHAAIAVESFLKARPAPAAYGMDSRIGAAQSTGAAFLAEQLK